jgi:hypothetical protein
MGTYMKKNKKYIHEHEPPPAHDLKPPSAPKPVTLINWFLDFAQLDPNGLSISEKFYFIGRYFEFIGPWIIDGQAFRPIPAEFLKVHAGSEPIDWYINDLVSRWYEAISWIVDHTNERWSLAYKIFHVTNWTSADSGGRFTTNYKGGPEIEADPILKVKLKKEPNFSAWAVKDGADEAPAIKAFPNGFQVFLEILDGYSTSNLRKCLHCDRIFFIHTRKLRSYCGPFCQKAAGMKRLRSRKKMVSR